MNAHILRQNYGTKQTTLHAMNGRDFKDFIESLDNARYPSVQKSSSQSTSKVAVA